MYSVHKCRGWGGGRGGEEEKEEKERARVLYSPFFCNNYIHIFVNAWCGQGVCFSYHTVIKLSMECAWCDGVCVGFKWYISNKLARTRKIVQKVLKKFRWFQCHWFFMAWDWWASLSPSSKYPLKCIDPLATNIRLNVIRKKLKHLNSRKPLSSY